MTLRKCLILRRLAQRGLEGRRALIQPSCDLITPSIVAASPGVISPHASAVVTAFIARDTFCGDGSSISPLPTAASDGKEHLTGRSLHRGSTRSRHSFIANMSPASAAQGFYTPALRVNPRASPLFREPRRRPAGLPDCPGWNSRLRPRAGGRGTISSLIELLSRRCVFQLIYGIRHCVNSNRDRPRPLMTRARSAEIAVSPVRRADRFSRRSKC